MVKLLLFDSAPDIVKHAVEFPKQAGHPTAIRKRIGSWTELKKAICSYKKIGTLVVWTHGSPGEIIIGGVQKNLDAADIINDFKSCSTKIDAIEFEGCEIGQHPKAMAKFGRLFSAKTVSGFTWFLVLREFFFIFEGSSTPSEVRADLKSHSPWMLQPPNYSQIAALTKRSKKARVKLLLHWYHPMANTQPPVKFGNSNPNYKKRSNAIIRRVTGSQSASSGGFQKIIVVP